MKQIVDSLDKDKVILVVPVVLLVAYGLLRLSTTLFAELRDIVFVKVTQRAMRKVALNVFRHLHALSLRFHLDRQTGGVTRDIERGTRGISTLLSYALFSVIPIVLEITLVTVLLAAKFDWTFVTITLAAIVLYIIATIGITEWRTHHRRQMNDMDSKANTKAVDSLLNYETVKYFGNEEFEAGRYDKNLQKYESAATKSETSLGILNAAQSFVIALAVTLLMWRASVGIVDRQLTIGDLVMVNVLMIQLYIPLNFLGVMYREITQALIDTEKMFRLLAENQEVADKPGAVALKVMTASVRFCFRLPLTCPQARPWQWLAPPARASQRCRVCCFVFMMSLMGASRSMDKIFAMSRKQVCVPHSVSCRRTQSCLTTRFATTSDTVAPVQVTPILKTRRAAHMCSILFCGCRTAGIRWSVNAV